MWGATPDMVCICGDPLGHTGWRACFGKDHPHVCDQCSHGNHLACDGIPCPCVHVQTKPSRRLRAVDEKPAA